MVYVLCEASSLKHGICQQLHAVKLLVIVVQFFDMYIYVKL